MSLQQVLKLTPVNERCGLADYNDVIGIHQNHNKGSFFKNSQNLCPCKWQ